MCVCVSLLCARHYSNSFMYTVSFKSHNHHVEWVLLSPPLNRKGDGGTGDSLSQLVGVREVSGVRLSGSAACWL